MSETSRQADVWEPCPTGALTQFARDQHGRRRRALFVKYGSLSVLALALIAVGGLVFVQRWSQEPNFGGLTCSEVRRHASELRAGALSEDLAAQVQAHLRMCPDCRSNWESMQRQPVARGMARAHDGSCLCDRCRPVPNARARVLSARR